MSAFVRALGSAMLVLAAVATAQADTIYMRNGSVIRGRVVGYQAGQFTVMLDGGGQSRAMLSGADIDRIEFEGSAATGSAQYDPPASDSRSYSPPPADPAPVDTTADDGGAYDPSPTTTDPVDAPADVTDAVPSAAPGSETSISVPAKSDWTSTQVRVRRGDRVRISAGGTVTLDRTGKRSSTPAGTDTPDRNKLVTGRPTGALIAVVGDDNDDFIFVGTQAEFTSQRDGMLFLSVNEGDLTDNSGVYDARIWVNGGGATSSARNTSTKQPESKPAAQPVSAATPRTTPANPAIRETNVTVPAKNDWTSTQIRVMRGSKIRITADGTIQLDRSGSRAATPAGIALADRGKLLASGPTGALIAVIGDDNDEFILVGDGTEFVATRDGLLFLSVNEGELSDNSGNFTVHLSVEQPRATASR